MKGEGPVRTSVTTAASATGWPVVATAICADPPLPPPQPAKGSIAQAKALALHGQLRAGLANKLWAWKGMARSFFLILPRGADATPAGAQIK